jgi:hypothetical protein
LDRAPKWALGHVCGDRPAVPKELTGSCRFVADSPLEGGGFELPVPREIGSVSTLGEE